LKQGKIWEAYGAVVVAVDVATLSGIIDGVSVALSVGGGGEESGSMMTVLVEVEVNPL
jgi:hypothetical protein